MTIVTRAIGFLTGLLRPPKRPVCPRCGSTLWKRHGFYGRGRRCLDKPDPNVGIQRYRCKLCGKTWSERPAWLAPRKWYGRDVIRMSLDLSMDGATSWRVLGSLVHGIVTGVGRGQRWAPWRKPKKGSEGIRLAHTTVWRWFQEAGRRAEKEDRVAGRYRELFSGALATDESWGWIRGIVEGVGWSGYGGATNADSGCCNAS